MAKPRELYSGPAPERTFAQMGAGIADAYARAGAIEGAGYQALGEGIAKGITGAASAYAGYAKEKKDMQSAVDADSKMFNAFKSYLPEQMQLDHAAMENDPNISLKQKYDYYQASKGWMGGAINQSYMMDRIKAQHPARPSQGGYGFSLDDSSL